jgi:hypothetical protein
VIPQAASSSEASVVADTGAALAAEPVATTDAPIISVVEAPSAESESTKKTRRQRHHRAPVREFAAEKRSVDRWVTPGTFSRR